MTAVILAIQVGQFVAFAVLGGHGSRSVLSIERTLGSMRRSLIEIDARLGALEAEPNGGDPHAHLMPGGLSPDRSRGQARIMEN
jgi:hypothetical protein